MEVTVHLPDDVARRLQAEWGDVTPKTVEALLAHDAARKRPM
jgi:hypothetical protein